jgi:tetratricopeptide (TPR) repeat protein
MGKSCGALLLCAVLLGTGRASSQMPEDSAYDAVTRRGIDYVYNLEFEKAEEEFGRLVALQPRHPAGYFFRAMVIWWKILVDLDNPQYDDQLFAALDEVEEMCDSILDVRSDDVTAIFFKGGAIGFAGRLRFHRDDWLGAANAGRKALPLVQRASDLDPNNYDIYLGTGIYNYYADVIPNEYPVVKPLLLFIPPGDRAKGIKELTLASQKAKYANVETAYFLMQIYYNYEKDYAKALELARSLNGRYPHNMLFHRYVGRCHVSMNNWKLARETFSAILDRVRLGERGYTAQLEREAEYYLGMSDMADREYEHALGHFYRCDELSRRLDRKEPSGFMVMANLKVGMIYDLQSRRDLAINQYEKVRNMKEFKDSHVQAEQLLNMPYR